MDCDDEEIVLVGVEEDEHTEAEEVRMYLCAPTFWRRMGSVKMVVIGGERVSSGSWGIGREGEPTGTAVSLYAPRGVRRTDTWHGST